MLFDLWAEPIHLGNLSKKVTGNAISALIFLVNSAPQVKDSKIALYLDGVNTVTLELLFLWLFQSDFSSCGENTGETEGAVCWKGDRAHLLFPENGLLCSPVTLGFSIMRSEPWA